MRDDPERVWRELVDWEGQGRWIPSTTVTVVDRPHRTGLGVRVPRSAGSRSARCRSDWSTARRHGDGLARRSARSRSCTSVPSSPGSGSSGSTTSRSTAAAGTRFTVTEDAERPSPGWSGCAAASPPSAGRGAEVQPPTVRSARVRRLPGPVTVAGPDGLAALPLGGLDPRLRRLPRRRVGSAGPQRERPLRAADPGGVPVGSVLDHDPAQEARRSGRRSPASTPPPSPRSTRPTSSG